MGGIGEGDSVGASEGFGAVHEYECGMGIEGGGHEDSGADLLRGSKRVERNAVHEDLLAVHGETGHGELGARDEGLGEIVAEETDESVEEFGLGPGGGEGFGGRVVGVLEAAVVGVGLGLVHGGFEDGELGVIGGAEGGFDFGEFAFAGVVGFDAGLEFGVLLEAIPSVQQIGFGNLEILAELFHADGPFRVFIPKKFLPFGDRGDRGGNIDREFLSDLFVLGLDTVAEFGGAGAGGFLVFGASGGRVEGTCGVVLGALEGGKVQGWRRLGRGRGAAEIGFSGLHEAVLAGTMVVGGFFEGGADEEGVLVEGHILDAGDLAQGVGVLGAEGLDFGDHILHGEGQGEGLEELVALGAEAFGASLGISRGESYPFDGSEGGGAADGTEEVGGDAALDGESVGVLDEEGFLSEAGDDAVDDGVREVEFDFGGGFAIADEGGVESAQGGFDGGEDGGLALAGVSADFVEVADFVNADFADALDVFDAEGEEAGAVRSEC